MSTYTWPSIPITTLTMRIHERALQNGRCAVFMRRNTVELRDATDSRNTRDAENNVGTFTAKDSHEHIHKCLLSAMLASTEDTRG